MKTEELRIGNYVKETVDNKAVTIASIIQVENPKQQIIILLYKILMNRRFEKSIEDLCKDRSDGL